MSDDYGTCPLDVFDDERFDGLSLLARATHTMLMVLADDWGRVSGSPWVLARKVGCDRAEMQDALELLVQAGLLEIYEAADESDKVIKVGQLVGFDGYRQHPRRVRDMAERGASRFPDREGRFESGKHRRKAEANDGPSSPEPQKQPTAPRRTTGARPAQTGAAPAQDRRTPGAQPAQPRSKPAHDRAPSRAEQSIAKQSLSPPQGAREAKQDLTQPVASHERPEPPHPASDLSAWAPLEGGARAAPVPPRPPPRPPPSPDIDPFDGMPVDRGGWA